MPIFSIPAARAWLTAILALAGTASALSQTITDTERESVVTLDRFVVTGSHLTPVAGAAPVTVVDAADIANSGVSTNILEVLRKQMPAFSGAGNLGASNASTGVTSTYGGARLSLHNLPTLVLLNGRRVSTNGANARGGSSFVDVNQFPLAAVDRIEVLTDGASAVYGSDAIGGVVNIILKPDYNGTDVGGRFAFSTRDGDYSERSGHFTTGASAGRLSLVVTGNVAKATPLYQGDRPFSSTANSTSFSGAVGSGATAMYLAPSIGSPRDTNPVGTAATAANMNALVANGTYLSGASSLNLAPDVTLLIGQEQRSATAAFTLKLIDRRLEAFGDFLYSKESSESQLGAQATTVTVPAGSPYNPTKGNVSLVNLRYLPAPRRYLSDAGLLRYTGGLKGTLSDRWSWETGYTYSRNNLVSKIANVLYGPNISRAVAGGYDKNGGSVAGGAYSRLITGFSETSAGFAIQPAFDPFARSSSVDPASLANVLGASRADFQSSLGSTDFVLRGAVLDLPAGMVGVAVGGDYRTENLMGTPDENSRNTGATAGRWSGGSLFDPFDNGRHIISAFGEIHLPLTGPKQALPALHSLDLSLAYRTEDYSDAGCSRVPKYSLRWEPVDDQVTVHGTYSKGFIAPALYYLHGPRISGSTTDISGALDLAPATTLRQATLITDPNPDLKPTTSTTRSAGVVFAPKALKGLTMSADYTDVELRNIVGSGWATILQSVNTLGSASPFASRVTLNAVAITTAASNQITDYVTGNGALSKIVVTDIRRNFSAAKVRTVDLAVDYLFPVSAIGAFKLGTTGTFFLHDKIQANPTEDFYEYAGLVTTTEGTMPGYRFYSTAGWHRDGWEITLGNTYIPGLDDLGPGGAPYANSKVYQRIPVGSYTAWDLDVAWTFRFKKQSGGQPVRPALTLHVGVDNLADKMPPVAVQSFGTPNPGVDAATYNPVGRLYYVSADVKF